MEVLAMVTVFFSEQFLDEAEGLKEKDEQLVVAAVNLNRAILTPKGSKPKQSTSAPNSEGPTVSPLTSKRIARPQLLFTRKPDNSYEPFVPIIPSKPNSIKPLAILAESTDDGIIFSHPYELELERFQPPDKLLTLSKPQVLLIFSPSQKLLTL